MFGMGEMRHSIRLFALCLCLFSALPAAAQFVTGRPFVDPNARGVTVEPFRLCLIGDSTFAQGSDASSSLNPSWYARTGVSLLRALAGRRIQMGVAQQFAVGGTDIENAVTVQIPAAIASGNCDGLIFGAGTNSFGSGHLPFDATIMGQINSALSQAQAAGMPIIFVIPTARDDLSASDLSQVNAFHAYRRWMLEWGRVNHVQVIDAWRETVQPYLSRPIAKVGYVRDGLHYAFLGGYVLGNLFLRELNQYLPAEQYGPVMVDSQDLASLTTTPATNPYGSLLDGGMFDGTAGTIDASCTICTGSVPTGWTLSYTGASTLGGTLVASIPTDLDGVKAFVITVTDLTSNGALPTARRETFKLTRSATNSAGLWAPGNIVQGMAQVSAIGGPRNVDYYVTYDNGAASTRTSHSLQDLADPNISVTVPAITSGHTYDLGVVSGTIGFVGCPGGPGCFSVVAGGGDTPTTIATALTALLMADGTFTGGGYSASSSGAVITVVSPQLVKVALVVYDDTVAITNAIGQTGQYGNLPSDQNIPWVAQTDRITLIDESAPGASSLTQSFEFTIDADPAQGTNEVMVRVRTPSVNIVPAGF